MSHSKIFQISDKPIKKDDRVSPSYFYDEVNIFGDYIDDTQYGANRKDCIKYLASELESLFDLHKSETALVYRGGLDEFKEKWTNVIREEAMKVTADNVLDHLPRYMLRGICNDTHLKSEYRFYIDGYNGWAGPMADLIEYISWKKFKPGKILYIGAVIDYHY